MGDTLSSPVRDKHTEIYETDVLLVGVCGMQGWRKNMEDAHLVSLNVLGKKHDAVFGVYDGHNGHCVAKYCGEHMAEALLEQPSFSASVNGVYGEDPNKDSTVDLKTAWQEAYISLDEKMSRDPTFSDGGCTAVSALILKKHIYTANAGDSRCILVFDDGSVTALSEDHKPTLPSEIERIRKAGGSVEQGRVNNIATSRALGDFGYRNDNPDKKLHEQPITSLPDVTETDMLQGSKRAKYLILACDGVWDVLTTEECAKKVTAKVTELKGDIGLVCEDILDLCLAEAPPGPGCDNMTIIIVAFKDEYYL